ncbi:YtpR family tRNA-binding protein [Rummeliibacillus pycnus]|uniref:YtpR family tRNA-binding protein n=1 Tax=Rummeliibacillus pycnus TaxID=101070 RepID=UPI0037C650AA
MIVSYNKAHVGDVLLVQLATEAIVKTELERHGDLVLLKEGATGEVKGFNLFNASHYLAIEEVGNIEVTKELVAKLEEVIAKSGATVSLDVDLSPKFVVGFVKEVGEHPNADKLHICKVDVGEDQPLQIVCGAPNVAEGQHVVVAKIGAVMPSGMVIKESALRGVDSYGMLCSARELAIQNAPQVKGIMILDDNAEVGSAFKF